jgi:hypothetical protein
LPKSEVLRLLGRNLSFETTVRRFAVSKEGLSEMVIIDQFEGPCRTSPSLMALQGSPGVQEFVKEESENGWPDLRLARGLKMKDLSPAQLQAIIETWMDAKRRYEREFGADRDHTKR